MKRAEGGPVVRGRPPDGNAGAGSGDGVAAKSAHQEVSDRQAVSAVVEAAVSGDDDDSRSCGGHIGEGAGKDGAGVPAAAVLGVGADAAHAAYLDPTAEEGKPVVDGMDVADGPAILGDDKSSAHAGAPAHVLRKRSEQLSQEYKFLYEDWDDEKTLEEIITVSTSFLERYTPEEREQYGFSEDNVRQRAGILVTPWFRFFMQYDPASALRKVGCPVLAVIGSKDRQVDPGMNLPAIEKALEEGGNPDHTVMELPGLNHMFQTAETGNPSEYAGIEETMAPLALETVSGWILGSRTGGKR